MLLNILLLLSSVVPAADGVPIRYTVQGKGATEWLVHDTAQQR